MCSEGDDAEVEECEVDALSMDDARLERLMGTDNYMALAQALDMTVTSGQTGQRAATGPTSQQ